MSDRLKAMLAIIAKDILIWLRTPVAILGTFLPPLAFLAVSAIAGLAVGRNPVALVVEGTGPQAVRLATILEQSDAFKVQATDAARAAQLLDGLQVAGIITIPADFDARYAAHQADPVEIRINNLNLDFTNDLRRSLPQAITDFYADVPDSPVVVSVSETDLRAQDVSLVTYMVVPNVALLVTVAGMLSTGLAMAREFEEHTSKELLLAPLPRWVVLGGKMLAGWFTTLGIAAIVLGASAATGILRGTPRDWAVATVTTALYGLTACGLGAAAGALTRRFVPAALLVINASIYLFFLSGGLAVASFLPAWLRMIAHVIPTYYAVSTLDEALFSHGLHGVAVNLTVLTASAVVALALGTAAVARSQQR